MVACPAGGGVPPLGCGFYWLPCYGLQIHSSDYVWLYLKGKQKEYDIVCTASLFAYKTSAQTHSIAAPSAIKIYPNPAHTYFRVDIPEAFQSIASMQVINVSGQKVYQKTLTDASVLLLYTQAWAKGNYILTITNGTQQVVVKLVKQYKIKYLLKQHPFEIIWRAFFLKL